MIILASNSPRRRQLLSLGGWDYSVMAVEVDEQPLPGENPSDYVLRLAQSKARAAARLAPAEAIILAADTTVVDPQASGPGLILGKPLNEADAEIMLRHLRGRTHQVFTGVAVLRAQDGAELIDLCETEVNMRSYTDEEIRAYVETGDPLDKAGAYAIQHTGFSPVESIQGCFTNVVGLPLCVATRALKAMGGVPSFEPLYACLYALQETCSISPSVLNGTG